MAKNIRKIPSKLNQFTSEPIITVKKRRVAGYARVSTDRDEQMTSYAAQMTYYKSYIERRDDWEFVGMYSDEGVTATNTKRRDGFKQMVEDALAGKIDLIITKSVSRFARNTVDSLTTIRNLKEKGVEVYFEKENIWTLDAKGELMITIMSSLAQEESRSISENTTWGKRKQFADGKGSVAYSWFLGYDKDFKINEEQAETVRLIYKLFIGGLSQYAITKELVKRGIKSPAGKDKWYISTIKSILTNEKYKGDALLQKQYTANYLQKTRKTNNGELPQYYVEEHHEAIIPPAQFDFVQAELARRERNGRYSGVNIFSNRIKCGCCGGWYGAKVWHSNDKYRKVVYRCNHKYNKETESCKTPCLTEDQIKQMFLKGLNELVDIKKETIKNLEEFMESLCRTDQMDLKQKDLKQKMEVLSESISKIIREKAAVALDQERYEDYEEKETSFRYLYEEANQEYSKLAELIQEKNDTRVIFTNFINQLNNLNGEQTEFKEDLWGGLVEYIRVDSEKSSTVILRGGIEINI